MINDLDCRGMSCPAPVLKVRETLVNSSPTSIAVLVDSDAARQNVCRFLEHSNYHVASEIQGDGFRVVGTRSDNYEVPENVRPVPIAQRQDGAAKKILVLVTSIHMGRGDDALGDMLQFNFLKTLKEMGPELWCVAFVNSGVSFTAEGSEAVPVLQELVTEGVKILACGACLAYFHVLDKIQVGEVSNMLDIVTSMKLADSVVTV